MDHAEAVSPENSAVEKTSFIFVFLQSIGQMIGRGNGIRTRCGRFRLLACRLKIRRFWQNLKSWFVG